MNDKTSGKIQIPTQIKEGHLKQEWKTHWNFRELGFGKIPSLESKLSSNMFKGSLPVLWNQYISIINKRKREIEINQTI